MREITTHSNFHGTISKAAASKDTKHSFAVTVSALQDYQRIALYTAS
jgi:hypothetical protein